MNDPTTPEELDRMYEKKKSQWQLGELSGVGALVAQLPDFGARLPRGVDAAVASLRWLECVAIPAENANLVAAREALREADRIGRASDIAAFLRAAGEAPETVELGPDQKEKWSALFAPERENVEGEGRCKGPTLSDFQTQLSES